VAFLQDGEVAAEGSHHDSCTPTPATGTPFSEGRTREHADRDRRP
jgi:hypothetical protein